MIKQIVKQIVNQIVMIQIIAMIIIALGLKTLMVQTSRVSPSLDNFLIASHRPPRLRQSPKWVVMPSTAMSVTQLKKRATYTP